MRRATILVALALVAAVAQDDFALTVDALARGTRAAGRVLLATGAHPLDGDDLGRRWSGGTVLRYRDRALGPGYRTVGIMPGGAAHFEQTFLAGQRAQIAIVPLDHAPFALSVKDDQGAVSCAAPPGGRCSWVPFWTTRYGIDVRNPGRSIGHYYMVVQ